jgi:hypothetical protein
MIHHTCDRCRRRIDPAQEVRYVVQINVQAVIDPPGSEESDDDRDHLSELNQMLEQLDLDDELDLEERRSFRFDLCPQCHRKYLCDPLGAEHLLPIGFSHN